MSHTHTLKFTGSLPSDEMERAGVLGHPDVRAARKALHDAFEEAGAPHTSESKVSKAREASATPRRRRGSGPAAVAAE